MTLYFLVLFALPSVGWLRRRYADRVEAVEAAADLDEAAGSGITLGGMATSLAVATFIGVAIGHWLR